VNLGEDSAITVDWQIFLDLMTISAIPIVYDQLMTPAMTTGFDPLDNQPDR